MTLCHCMGSVQSDTGEEKVALELQPEDNHRRCRSDMVWQTVRYISSGNWKGLVTRVFNIMVDA